MTADQAQLSATLKVQASEIGKDHLLAELDKLTIEYDTIRRAMPGGSQRTRQMTRIVVQMRALSQAVSDMIGTYQSSGSAGSRLAAVVMMQMEPEKADIDWLEERFGSEHPFIFYHAALALQNVINSSLGSRKDIAIAAVKEALVKISSFSGPPDKSTVQVLKALIC